MISLAFFNTLVILVQGMRYILTPIFAERSLYLANDSAVLFKRIDSDEGDMISVHSVRTGFRTLAVGDEQIPFHSLPDYASRRALGTAYGIPSTLSISSDTFSPSQKDMRTLLPIISRMFKPPTTTRTFRTNDLITCHVWSGNYGIELAFIRGRWSGINLNCGSDMDFEARVDLTFDTDDSDEPRCQTFSSLDVWSICYDFVDLFSDGSTGTHTIITSLVGPQVWIDNQTEETTVIVGCSAHGLTGNNFDFSDKFRGVSKNEIAAKFRFSSVCKSTASPFWMYRNEHGLESFPFSPVEYEPLVLPLSFPKYSGRASSPSISSPLLTAVLFDSPKLPNYCTIIGPNHAVVLNRPTVSSPWLISALNCNGEHFDLFGSIAWSDTDGSPFLGSCSALSINQATALQGLQSILGAFCSDPQPPNRILVKSPNPRSFTQTPKSPKLSWIPSYECSYTRDHVEVRLVQTEVGIFRLLWVGEQSMEHSGDSSIELLVDLAECSALAIHPNLLLLYSDSWSASHFSLGGSHIFRSKWGSLRIKEGHRSRLLCQSSQWRAQSSRLISTDAMLVSMIASPELIPWVSLCVLERPGE